MLCTFSYSHICLCILNYDVYVMFRSFLPKWSSQYGSDLGSAHILDHFSLQVMAICASNFFSWNWAYFCVNWVIHEERMKKSVVRRLEFSNSETQLGEFVGRECSLRQVQSIPDNQLIVYTCLCCKNDYRSCNRRREKLTLASYLLPYRF